MSAIEPGGVNLPGARSAFGVVRVVAARELAAALRNRWFLLYTLCFAGLSLALSFVALAGTGRYGFAGFGRTAASLINLVLLIVPLMALTAGAGSVAGERERGTLEPLLAQPVARWEVLLGKWAGMALALAAALALGFGATALLLGTRGAAAGLWRYATIFGFSVLLAWSMLSVGLLISTLARGTPLALGVAIFGWLTLVFFGDLGLMSGAIALRLSADELLAAALVNPLQVFKLLAISSIHSSLDLLGPAGTYAAQTFGGRLPWLLGTILAAWTVIPLGAALLAFSRKGSR
ncbi:MAG: ABC transporter permease [Planctomycetota bacterium]